MKHPIIDDLKWRYTTKKYDHTRKISPQDLEILLQALRLSASSINSQPWKFVVIESEAAKTRLDTTFVNKYQFNRPHVRDSSQVILFAHHPNYTRNDYSEVVDNGIEDGRTQPANRENAFGGFIFAEMNTDTEGNTSHWTKAQLYIALGNFLHTLARLKIDSTPMEGIDADLVNQTFESELDGYRCELAVAIGYRHPEDYNAVLPKSRRRLESIFVHI